MHPVGARAGSQLCLQPKETTAEEVHLVFVPFQAVVEVSSAIFCTVECAELAMSFASWAKSSTAGPSKLAGGSCSIESDVQVKDGPSDSISALSFSPVSDHLAVSSWDNSVRVYEVGQGGAVGRAAYNHEAPALDVCWSHDGLKAFSGGVDNAGRMLDVQTGSSSQVAQHTAPVKSVRWTDMHGGLLITGSWDKTLKVLQSDGLVDRDT